MTIASMPHHPDRALPLQGASNFRDLGGYVGHGGRALRWRRLFRSDHLAGLTASDHAVLARLGLTRTFDFRGVDERAATPYALPGVAQHSLSIEPTVVQSMQAMLDQGQSLTAATTTALMTELYRNLVNDHSQHWATLFAHLLDTDGAVVFHCTAGKDRTGLAAALILLALGVPRNVVMQDYLLTNALYRHHSAPITDIPAEALAVLWRVQPGFLDAALQLIDTQHGGLTRYLDQRMGLNGSALALLAQRYLDPVDSAAELA